jgi:hypothetical protein
MPPARHGQVEHRDVGVQRARQLACLMPVGRLADDLVAGFLQQPAQALADNPVVIGQQ